MGVRLRTKISKPITSQTKIRHGWPKAENTSANGQSPKDQRCIRHDTYNIVLICRLACTCMSVQCTRVSVQCACTSVSCTRMSVLCTRTSVHVRAVSVQCPCSVRAVYVHVHAFSKLINDYWVIHLHRLWSFWPSESWLLVTLDQSCH